MEPILTNCKGFRDVTEDMLATLRQRFDTLTTGTHWKDPIQTEIPAADFAAMDEACQWFTATPLVRVSEPGSDGKVKVVADGYRNGPAGP